MSDSTPRAASDMPAGYVFRQTLVPRADDIRSDGSMLWRGWAIMDAFLAGIDHERAKAASFLSAHGACVEALKEIENPISYMRQRAEAEGAVLNEMALHLANDPEYLRSIARATLAALEALEKANG